MAVTVESATNEIYGVITTAWQAACVAAGMAEPGLLVFDTLGGDGQPVAPQAAAWARVHTALTASRPRSIGGRLWQIEGLATVAMHFPQKSYGEAAGTLAMRFAEALSVAFRKHRNGNVNFTTATPGRKGVDGPSYRYDVSANFRYLSISEG
jgi:hypothetical protein